MRHHHRSYYSYGSYSDARLIVDLIILTCLGLAWIIRGVVAGVIHIHKVKKARAARPKPTPALWDLSCLTHTTREQS